ncbi:pirin family protein [Fontibacillus sp. BL9]|uniref:pirin family protein n=1 Tax=Fontibacillus sp. BL9 TaxID=3389971 RepID=UPI003978B6C3
MIKVVTSEERHTARYGPVHSEFSFSFADYDDPGNAHFGCLLVLNDHTLVPGKKLEPHPHHDLEILTYVISGTLGHSDGSGDTRILPEGSFQVLSAGTGVTHAEFNPSEQDPVRYLQLWFLPDRRNLTPSRDDRQVTRATRVGISEPVVSGKGNDGRLRIHQDVDVYVPVFADNREILIPTHNRRQHLFLISGHIEFECGNQQFSLRPGDAARIQSGHDLKIRKTGEEQAELMVIDMP